MGRSDAKPFSQKNGPLLEPARGVMSKVGKGSLEKEKEAGGKNEQQV